MDIQSLENAAIFNEWSEHRSSYKRSLVRAQEFAVILGFDPSTIATPLVGVVGSKGKGTASIYTAAALASQGLRVGLITSPELTTNRDRIRINGQALSEKEYRALLAQIEQAKNKLPDIKQHGGYLSPTGTFIVAGTALLLEKQCDVLVIEAGMGGSSDELSLFNPNVALVTAIFGEHLDVLGPTIEDVAINKLGIVKESTTDVVALAQSSIVQPIITAACKKTGAKLHTIDANSASQISYRALLPPGFNTLNALAGITAAKLLYKKLNSTPFNEQKLNEIVKTVNYPGRLSVHNYKNAVVVLDAPVSGEGLEASLNYARQKCYNDPDIILVSLPNTKDLDGYIRTLEKSTSKIIFVHIDRPNLQYPSTSSIPWESITEEGLHSQLHRYLVGNVLAVGTVSFINSMFKILGVTSEKVFSITPETR
jgi:dihydrofolate synthase/folylpolyglutamate synthase